MPAEDKIATCPQAPQRLLCLDAYRGFVMLLMMAEVLEFWKVSEAYPRSRFWTFLAQQQSHAEWIGCNLHDLIQPSFSFLVGVVLPFSVASRVAKGQSKGMMFLHAGWRSLLLVLLGVFLRSIGQPQTYWTFEDTLSQIGLGYIFLFALGFASTRLRIVVLVALIFGYWTAFALYPLPSASFDFAKVGVDSNWPHLLSGFAAHWNKNSNLAWAFDTWFLNLFPRTAKFIFNEGGYATLSFIPTLATMILGLLAGDVLKINQSPQSKLKWLVTVGISLVLLGLVIGGLGWCPVVKRIWTPSWVLFSGGLCFLLLAAFFTLTDIWNLRKWSFPLVVIGANSIAAYCFDHLLGDFIHEALVTHFGKNAFALFGSGYAPMIQGLLILAIFWCLLFWMYRRKLFLKI